VDRPHPQVNNTTKTLSGGPAGGAYPPFCEGLQTAWFAVGLQQIFFPINRVVFAGKKTAFFFWAHGTEGGIW
jgi:hypothetical protein